MLEEERKAIEYFEDLNKLYGLGIDTLKYTESEYDNSKILLNLIEKQQKELEKKDKIIKDAIHYITIHYDFDGDTKAPYPTETEYNVLEILKGK